MLPALTPTQTVSNSDGRRSASPDCRIQWHRYVASPPSTSRTSASRTQGIQRSSPMLGSAVSSRRPTDFQPRPLMWCGGSPTTKPRTEAGPHTGWPHCAVGMQSALDSAIGLPSRPMSASWMLGFVTPPDVSSNLIIPLLNDVKGAERLLQPSSLKQYEARWVDVMSIEHMIYMVK